MKILYLTKHPKGTGSGTYADSVITAMRERHDITVKSYETPLSGDWDIVHALDMKHFQPETFPKLQSPLLIDVHDYYWTRFYPFFCLDVPLRFILQKIRAPKYRNILKNADGIIVHSQFMQEKIPHSPKFLVRLGIDIGKFRSQPAAPSQSPQVLFVGRDYFRKGIYPLLQAMKIVQAQIPDAKLWVVGKEYPHSLKFCQLLSRNLNVEFINGLPNPELVELYAQSSVFVLPSHIEAFGIVFLEAMAAKVPVVGTTVGGIPEIVRNGETGFLIPPNCPEKLADVIIKILKDGKKIEDIVDKAYKFVSENFTIDKMIEDLETVYGKFA